MPTGPPSECADLSLRIKLPRDPGAAAVGRRWLATFLSARGWGSDRQGTGLQDALLLTSELITNAITHGVGDEIALALGYQEDAVCVAVENRTHGAAFFGMRGTESRGLELMSRLADCWGIEVAQRTRVWFSLGLN